MFERIAYHHFSLKSSYPRYIKSVDNIGNTCIEIELVDDLCTTEGRIATDSFVFHDLPDFAAMDPLSKELFREYFKLMRKLALCFEFISIKQIYNILGWAEPLYAGYIPEHLKYPDVYGFMEMQHGPAIMLIHYIIHRQMVATGDKSYKFVKKILHRMAPLIRKRNRRHGYYVKRFHWLKEGRSCHPIKARAINELEHKYIDFDIYFIPINGLSLVLRSNLRKFSPAYISKYQHNVIRVRGIGIGVSLLDVMAPIERAYNSWYNWDHLQLWGPLYPAIIFEHEPEKQIRIIDLSFFD